MKIRAEKIRGWKKYVKRLDAWKHQNLTPPSLEQTGFAYLKLSLLPYERLYNVQPPLWLKRKIVQAFLDIYHSWHEQIQPKSSGRYLKLWLYDQRFPFTQIVAAEAEKSAQYITMFPETAKINKKVPAELFTETYGSGSLRWESYIDEEPFLEKADGEIYSESELKNVLKKAHRTENTSDSSDTIHYLKKGTVWVGSE